LDPSDSTGETCIVDAGVTVDNTVRCQVCSLKANMHAVVESGSSSVTCGCSLGWYGEACESDVCSSDSQCRDNETCDGSGECVCADDWYMSPLGYCIYDSTGACSGCGSTGSYGTCEFVTSDTEMSCECEDDWYGISCYSGCPIIDDIICSNHGSCNDSEHICECDSGYIGDACSTLVVTYSSDCARSFTIEDHMTCQEVSSGHTLSQCSSYIDGHRMCVLPDDGSTAPSLGCRSVWYGDECDDMYSVHLADLALRKEVCSLLTSGDGLCDVSAFDFAATSFDLSINDAADITSLIGLSDCLNVSSVSLSSLSVTSVSVLTSLRQVVAMSLIALDTRTSMIDSTAILSLSPLQSLSRLQTVSVYDNKHLFDVSVLYRNISLSALYISDTETGEYIPLCRSEDDETYWTYISTVYPVHESDSSLKARQFLATSCPLNSYGTFSCDVTESL
ncbi:hypothetical protein ADUPG1_011597, partial [Aduncisulcus paluster]